MSLSKEAPSRFPWQPASVGGQGAKSLDNCIVDQAFWKHWATEVGGGQSEEDIEYICPFKERGP